MDDLLTYDALLASGALATALFAIYKVVIPAAKWIRVEIIQPVVDTMELKEHFDVLQRGHVDLRNQIDGTQTMILSLADTVNSIASEFVDDGNGTMKSSVKRTERAVVRGQKIHWAVMENNPEGIFEMDSKGEVTQINKSLLYLCGSTREDMKGQGWVNAIAEEDRVKAVDNWANAFRHQRDCDMTFRIFNPMSRQFTKVSFKAVRLSDDNTGATLGYHGRVQLAEE